MSAGRPPTLWWLLIDSATPSLAARLDHVGVERPLDEPGHVAELARLLLEDADELLADPLALLLGVADARRASRGSAPAPATWTSGTRKWPSNVSTTCSASSLRRRPWSTKTHVSWSPTALWTSSAATALSTPPGERRRGRARGRRARGSARPAPRSRPRASRSARRRRRRRGSSSAPPGRAGCGRPRGGTGRRRGRAPASSKAAIGVERRAGDDARARGRRDDASRGGYIQTVCSAGQVAEEARRSPAVELGLPELADAGAARRGRRARAPSAACRNRCRASGSRARRSPGRQRGAPSA